MAKIIEKDNAALQESYYQQTGKYPTAIGNLFGWGGQRTVYNIAEQVAQGVDKIFWDYPPFSNMQDLLIGALQWAYDWLAWYSYWDYAYIGDGMSKWFEDIIADYKNRVSQAVQDAKNLVQREFIDPLQNQTNALQVQIKTATAQLENLNILIDRANKALANHDIRLADLEAAVKKNPLENLFKLG